MSDGILTVLKFCLLALVYIFLMRAVALVSSELKGSPAVVVASQAGTAEPKQKRRGWRVTLIEPPGTGQVWDVVGELTIGRAGGCAIARPDDTYISQVHARIFERGSDPWVEDLGSTNGTLVNGKLLEAARKLKRGDRVQAGSTVLEVGR